MKNLLLILSILFCQGAFAQWYQVNSNTTKNLNDIYFIDSLRGYCVGGDNAFPQSDGVILHSTDGGENWSTIFSIDSVSINFVAVVSENTSTKLYAYGFNNWEPVIISTELSDNEPIWSIEPIDYFPVLLKVYNNQIYFIDYYDFNLKRKVNESNQMETLHAEIGYFNINEYGIIAFTEDLAGILLSTDYGDTWSAISPPIGATHPTDLAMFEDTIILTNWYDSATFFSYDGGATWSFFDGGLYQNTTIISPNMLFTATISGNVSYTNNTGESWNWMGDYNVEKFYFKDNLGFMVGPEGSIYKLDNVGALGLNEPLKTNLKIYPNPSSDYITLDFDETVSILSVELVDVNGKAVKTYTTNQTQLDLTGLASGVYILKVETDKGLVSKRIVVD